MNNLAASASTELAPTSAPTTVQDCENQIWEGSRSGSDSDIHRQMYIAVLSGDLAAAKMLLKQDEKLTQDAITEDGNRALHLSIAMKHEKLAQELIKLMKPDDLKLKDGRGFTACCYASISDKMVGIARLLTDKNSEILAERNKEGRIPLQTASLSGKKEMISFLLGRTGNDSLKSDEWFDLLLSAISTKMYDIASTIVKRYGSLAIMSKKDEVADKGTDSMSKKEEVTDSVSKKAAAMRKKYPSKRTKDEGIDPMSKKFEGTALHMLARQNITETSTNKMAILLESILGTTFYGRQNYGEMQPDSRELARKLLDEMEKQLESEKGVVELLQNPPILCDAARVGNVELIVMLTRKYPDLLWQTDSHRRSIFHYAVMYRQDNVFSLIRQIGGLKNLVVMEIDAEGNNILHLAAKSAHPNARTDVSISALQMQRELAWFKQVEAIVPTTYIEMKNKQGKKPREVFSEEHNQLFKWSISWMKSTADSCMLIATIILTVVYAAAFTVPGGTNGETGLPILVSSNWFTCFFVFEALALFGSTLCIIVFWSINSSAFKEERFLDILPYQLKLGLSGLFGSLIGAISAFMSAYCLVLVNERAWLVKCIILVIYVMLILAICGRFSELWFKMNLPKSFRRMLPNQNSQTLFSENHTTGKFNVFFFSFREKFNVF